MINHRHPAAGDQGRRRGWGKQGLALSLQREIEEECVRHADTQI